MWIVLGIISLVILVLVVLWLVNSRPKAVYAEKRMEQLGYKYEANPTRLPPRRAKGEIKTEIVGGPMNASGSGRARSSTLLDGSHLA
jgi:hypothetical protein